MMDKSEALNEAYDKITRLFTEKKAELLEKLNQDQSNQAQGLIKQRELTKLVKNLAKNREKEEKLDEIKCKSWVSRHVLPYHSLE